MEVSAFLGFVVLGFLVVLAFILRNKCPNCDRRRAMKTTGRTLTATNRTIWGSTSSYIKEEEWQCKYCGHVMWKEPDDYPD